MAATTIEPDRYGRFNDGHEARWTYSTTQCAWRLIADRERRMRLIDLIEGKAAMREVRAEFGQVIHPLTGGPVNEATVYCALRLLYDDAALERVWNLTHFCRALA